MSLAVVLVEALLFGWYLVLLLITAVGGGFFGLTPTGVLIDTGLSSVHFPWTAISGTSEDALEGKYRSYPVLRLSIFGDYRVPGWPWPAALSPVLLGSSRRKLAHPGLVVSTGTHRPDGDNRPLSRQPSRRASEDRPRGP